MLNYAGKISRAAPDRRVAGQGRGRGPFANVAILLLCAPLGACGMNKVVGAPEVAYDYRERHPVVLAEAPYSVDIFPGGGERLDPDTVLRIKEFVARYRKLGEGRIAVLAPRGPGAQQGRRSVDEVRRALAAFGAGPSIYIGSYPATDPSLAAPIRLTFNGVKAKVAGPCGEWPDDLASGNSLEGWQNKSYYNFGCANQATLAAQVADPRDLAAPRGETPQDVETRMRAIGKIRQGADPATSWNTKAATISGVGGN
ncbi:MAG TPA: CpaD family pilus assembly protein [Methylocystis sp.]|nr:CpaD family pilus assembly protein [Methylocystis sp.]